MHDIKIIVDANVIIAASIFEHRYSGQAIRFFDMLKENHKGVMGIHVPTVREEMTYERLVHTARETWDERRISPEVRRMIYDDENNRLHNIDVQKEGLLNYLDEMNLEGNDLEINLENVVRMSSDLRSRYDNASVSEQSKLEQLCKFINNHRNDADERILAEAITIKQRLTDRGGAPLLLPASFDTGFFSPRPGVNRSDEVTREIFERFEITCDFPHIIRRIVEDHQFGN